VGKRNNLPDLSLLVELADFYNVEIRELINGERKSEKMDKTEKETLLMVADYSNEEKAKLLKRIHALFIVGLIVLAAAVVITGLGLANTEPYDLIAGLGL
jgi:transcriptional regulator with XRE-family HTH domain